MKTMNQLIGEYTNQLKQGEMQIAYKGILDFVGKLRGDFTKQYPDYDIGAIYQGYMDMTYFSLSTRQLKEKGLKIAIVYLHPDGAFQVWLSSRNREIAKSVAAVMGGHWMNNANLFHDKNNPDAIVECTLAATPDFDDPDALIRLIKQGVMTFVKTVDDIL